MTKEEQYRLFRAYNKSYFKLSNVVTLKQPLRFQTKDLKLGILPMGSKGKVTKVKKYSVDVQFHSEALKTYTIIGVHFDNMHLYLDY